jgi:hypothetical protein
VTALSLWHYRVLQIDHARRRQSIPQLRVARGELGDKALLSRTVLDHLAPATGTNRARWPGVPSEDAAMTEPAPDTTELNPVPREIPDLRRDAIEEAAETSPEARERIQRLNAVEAAADPTLHRPGGASR